MESPKAAVPRLFFKVHKLLEQCLRRSFEDCKVKITIPQSLVISALMKHGKMKISELSERIYLSNSTVSGIVDRLEKQQLVIRERSNEDRRIVYVKLTPKFEHFLRDVNKKAEQIFSGLLDSASPEEIGRIIEGLETLEKIIASRVKEQI